MIIEKGEFSVEFSSFPMYVYEVIWILFNVYERVVIKVYYNTRGALL